MSRLPPSASIATPSQGAKLCAPSAERNTPAIVSLMRDVAPATGRALEIASGTGQHVTALASALPTIEWHPSEIAVERIISIDAYAAEAALPNLHPAQLLDACTQGWAATQKPYDLIYLSNLLHLIPDAATQTLVHEAAKALSPEGTLVLYGPFSRGGVLTSQGDAQFDAELRAADPAIGYKDDQWIIQLLTSAGLGSTLVRDMPANNLAFISKRENS